MGNLFSCAGTECKQTERFPLFKLTEKHNFDLCPIKDNGGESILKGCCSKCYQMALLFLGPWQLLILKM